MPDQKSVTVEDTATEVLASREADEARVQNVGPNTAYFGNDEVTEADGYPVSVDGSIRVQLVGEESLHAICTEGENTEVRVLA